MKFLCVGEWKNKKSLEAIGRRFLDEGDPLPPGIELHGRWHDLGTKTIWTLVETDDAALLQAAMAKWADDVDFDAHPVLDDAECGAVLKKVLDG